jgi:hypothetical protein
MVDDIVSEERPDGRKASVVLTTHSMEECEVCVGLSCLEPKSILCHQANRRFNLNSSSRIEGALPKDWYVQEQQG